MEREALAERPNDNASSPHRLRKEHLSERQPLPEKYVGLSDDEDGRAHRRGAKRGSAAVSSSSATTTSATK